MERKQHETLPCFTSQSLFWVITQLFFPEASRCITNHLWSSLPWLHPSLWDFVVVKCAFHSFLQSHKCHFLLISTPAPSLHIARPFSRPQSSSYSELSLKANRWQNKRRTLKTRVKRARNVLFLRSVDWQRSKTESDWLMAARAFFFSFVMSQCKILHSERELRQVRCVFHSAWLIWIRKHLNAQNGTNYQLV